MVLLKCSERSSIYIYSPECSYTCRGDRFDHVDREAGVAVESGHVQIHVLSHPDDGQRRRHGHLGKYTHVHTYRYIYIYIYIYYFRKVSIGT